MFSPEKTAHAVCVNAGAGLAAAALPDHGVTRHCARHQSSEPRPVAGAPDVGAFEYSRIESRRLTQFGPSASNPAIAADTADADRDSSPNLAEYALTLDPETFSGGEPAWAAQSIGGV